MSAYLPSTSKVWFIKQCAVAEELFEVDGDTMLKMIDEAGTALQALKAALK